MKNITLVKDRLDGASNFIPWKSKLLVTLEEDDLLDVATKTLLATEDFTGPISLPTGSIFDHN